MFQGLLRAHKDYHDTKNAMSRLWVHECFRVFCDRLVGEKDQETFVSLISEKLGSIFDLTYHNLCPNKIPPIFGEQLVLSIIDLHITAIVPHRAGDFMRGEDVQIYEDITKFSELKKLMEEQLEDYNMEPGYVTMNLVLFRDAIEHGINTV